MPNYAVVNPQGGSVSNIVVGEDLATVEAVVGPCVEMTENTGSAAIGWIWNGTKFIDPNEPEEPTP